MRYYPKLFLFCGGRQLRANNKAVWEGLGSGHKLGEHRRESEGPAWGSLEGKYGVGSF